MHSTFSVLEYWHNFPRKAFYQPLIFEQQTGSEAYTDTFQSKNCAKLFFYPYTYLLSCPNFHILKTSWWFRRFSKTLTKTQFFACAIIMHQSQMFCFIPFASLLHHAELTCSKIALKIWFLTQWARMLWFWPFLTKTAYMFRLIVLWQENAAKPIAMHRQIFLLSKK